MWLKKTSLRINHYRDNKEKWNYNNLDYMQIICGTITPWDTTLL